MSTRLRKLTWVISMTSALTLISAVIMVPIHPAPLPPATPDTADTFSRDHIMIAFQDETARSSFMDRTGLQADDFSFLPSIGFYIVDLPESWDATTAISLWTDEPGVTSIMRDFLPVYSAIPVPDAIKTQWGFQQTRILEAQTKVTTTNQVKVGIIDGAVSTTNPFLAERLISPRIFPEVDQAGTAHATAVASIIASIAPRNATIYSYGVVTNGETTAGGGSASERTNLFTALENASADKVKVVNFSLGYCNEYYYQYPDFRQFSELFHQKLLDLAMSGVIIVASAGNGTNGLCTDNKLTFPAVWSDATIAVGGAKLDGSTIKPTAWSSKGYSLFVIAPAENVMTYYPSTLQNLAGTSFAAPYVSGTAVLMLATSPTLSLYRMRDIISGTARFLEGYSNIDQGWGFLDAASAVQAAADPVTPARTGPLTIDISGIKSLDYTRWPKLEVTSGNGAAPKATTSYISYINTSYTAHYKIPEISTQGKSELYVFFSTAGGRQYCSINEVKAENNGEDLSGAFSIRSRESISYVAGTSSAAFNTFTALSLDVTCGEAPPVVPPEEPPVVSPSLVPLQIVYMPGQYDSVGPVKALIASANEKMTTAGILRTLTYMEPAVEFDPSMIVELDSTSCLAHDTLAVRIYAGSALQPCPMGAAPDYPAIALGATEFPASDTTPYRLAANIFSRRIGIALGARSLAHLKTTVSSGTYEPNTPGLMYDPAFSRFEALDAKLINNNTNVPNTNYFLWRSVIPAPQLAGSIMVRFYDKNNEIIPQYRFRSFKRTSDLALAGFGSSVTYAVDSEAQDVVSLYTILPDLTFGTDMWTNPDGIMMNEVQQFELLHDGTSDTYYFDSADLNRIVYQIQDLDASGTYSGLYLDFHTQGAVSMELLATDFVLNEKEIPPVPVDCGELPKKCNPEQKKGNHAPTVERWFFDGSKGPLGINQSDVWDGGNEAPRIKAGEIKTFIVYYENNDGLAPKDHGQEIQASARVSAGTINASCNGPHNDDQEWALTYDSTGVTPGTLVTITIDVIEPNGCSNKTGSGSHTLLVE